MRKYRLQHYELGRRLGEGAHGVVYLAYDSRLLRWVVVKRLRRRLSSYERQRERILREARLASAIDHPNVCAIYEIHDEPGEVYIVMQYVAGRPLGDLLVEGGLSVPLSISLAQQIAEGLAAAHELGVVHRDLKPANIVVSESGLVKILDFGLARRHDDRANAAPRGDRHGRLSASSEAGPAGFMAPEQFVGGAATPQSDLFAVGVLMYMMLSGAHPFAAARTDPDEIARATQFQRPRPLATMRTDVPADIERVVIKCLAKDPSERYQSAAELRDALTTLTSTAPETDSRLAVSRVAPAADLVPRKTGLWSMLRAFVSGSHPGPAPGTVAVLPFEALEAPHTVTAYGFALANAIATKLARLPGISVRPATSLLSMSHIPADPTQAGERLDVSHVVSGTYAPLESGHTVTWQLIDVARAELLTGDTLGLADLEFIELQTRVSDSVFRALRGTAHIPARAPAGQDASPPADVAEDYFEARALLSSFVLRSHHRKDLDAARNKLERVAEAAPDFAPVHAALGIACVQYARNGFGAFDDLQRASEALERALVLDPGHLEAKVFRVHTMLSLGEKASARETVRHLIEIAPTVSSARLVAATLLRLDGAYDEALGQLASALAHDPNDAHIVYNHRARILHYRGDLDGARREATRALDLQPKHPLLRATDGYLRLRESDAQGAADVLEAVVRDDPTLQLAYPTLAIARRLVGDHEGAESLITEQTVAAAHCDGETAYRLATYYAIGGQRNQALRWLRRAIHLGNENYPWLATNPAWSAMQTDEDFRAVLARLEDRFRRNLEHWRRALPGHAPPKAVHSAPRNIEPRFARGASRTEPSGRRH